MEMENEAQNDLAVPLISCDDPAFNAADAGRRSSLDDIEKVVPTEGAPSVADVDDTDKRNVTALSLAMIIFYNASGGPFGTEPSVKAAGNFYAILGLALMPILWAFPEVYMTYKLSEKHPCASGGALWVELAFGERMGLMVGYLGWLGGVVMGASYAALLYEYVVSQFFQDKGTSEVNPLVRYGAILSVAVALTAVNYRGLNTVGRTSILMYVLTMSPFLIMVIVGLSKADPSKWLQRPPVDSVEVFDDDSVEKGTEGWMHPLENVAGIAFGPYLNNLYWNFNNFDQAGHYSTSVSKNVFRKGISGSLFLVSTAYLLPILAATGATDLQQDDWKPGALAVAGSAIVGNWLGVWIVISSGISLASCFFAEISADSLQLMGMASRKLPKVFGAKSRFDTPTYSIIACLVVIASVIPFDFGLITELCNFGYCLSVSVEFMAFAKLQILLGDDSKPRKILYALMLLPPMAINVLIILLASATTYIYTAAMVLVGLLIFHVSAIKKFLSRSGDETKETTEEEANTTVL